MYSYTKEMFKSDLRKLCGEKYDPRVIAKITSNILFSRRADIHIELEDKMLDLVLMEEGPEFEMTEAEFKDFMDKL